MSLLLRKAKKYKTLCYGILYLFQVSAIIGILLGHQQWFMSKTPLLLLLNLSFLILLYPLQLKNLVILVFLFVAGMAVEWVGVHYDFLFGAYHYGNNLGPKFYGVPWLIGVNWLILVITTAALAKKLVKNNYLAALIGAGLMLFLDFFIEPVAPRFDFWIWEQGSAPLQNFIAWFIISVVLQFVFTEYYSWKQSNVGISLHVYVSQLLFFGFFYLAAYV